MRERHLCHEGHNEGEKAKKEPSQGSGMVDMTILLDTWPCHLVLAWSAPRIMRKPCPLGPHGEREMPP